MLFNFSLANFGFFGVILLLKLFLLFSSLFWFITCKFSVGIFKSFGVFEGFFTWILLLKFKNINEEDSVEELKKQIEILLNLINTNALDKLDEPKKLNFNSYSRQSSLKSIKYKSNKKLLYLKIFNIKKKYKNIK